MFSRSDLDRHYRYCCSLTGNDADAFDLLQSGLETCLRKPPSNTLARHAYLRRILHNRFIDQQRARQRAPLADADEAFPVDVAGATLEDLVVEGLDFERVWTELQPAEREILYYWAVEGYTAAEIAEELEMPRGTVLSRVHRLRLRLRGMFGDAGEVLA